MKRSGDPQGEECGDLRCLCGSLVARWVPGGLELKCRRCKRRIFVPVPEDPKATEEPEEVGSG